MPIATDARSSGSNGVKIVEKHPRKLAAIFFPVAAGSVVVESGDPVDVELVNGRVDAISLEPAFGESAGIAKCLIGTPFGEPCVLSQEPLERLHAVDVAPQAGHRRPADVQLPLSIVVQFKPGEEPGDS